MFIYMILSVSLPIKILVLFLILWFRLGSMSFLVLLMIFLTIIVQMGCGKIYAFIFKGMSSIKDERLKMLTELIEGVKILKIHSW